MVEPLLVCRSEDLTERGLGVQWDLRYCGMEERAFALRIDGQVHGNVATADGQAGTLVVSEHAKVEGEIRVSHIVINGTVEGPVAASDYLELQPKARVTGDVAYKTLEMHVGAVVQGRLNHGQAEPESAAVVELKRVGA